jgi:hypothetical protein
LSGGPSQLVSRGHTSAPRSVNGAEYDRIGGMVAHWTPVLEDLDSSRFSPGTPSLHSKMMSPSAPYGPSYGPVNIAHSHNASEDVPTTSHPASSRTNPDAAIAKWFGQLAGDTGFQHDSPTSDID